MYPLINKKVHYYSLVLIVVLTAIAFRLPNLTQRPMHSDEAVQAAKFGLLLENNYYLYDNSEYHGPTLYYLTLIPAWLESAQILPEIDESTLRIVPVVFGILLIVLLYMCVSGLNWPVVTSAGIFTAISPAMVFYSRYYIQEMLLVFLILAVIVSGYRYYKSLHFGWVVTTGFFLGLMHATKETSIIAFGAMLIALFCVLITEGCFTGTAQKTFKSINYSHCAVFIAVALLVSALFYSSFFTNPAGISDSYLAYTNYFNKAANADSHIQPWHYYLKLLIFSKGLTGQIWSEALIVLLAVIGSIVAISKKGISGVDFRLVRFFFYFTLISVIIYAAIPYKTPWNMLGFLQGMIVLAGVGAVAAMNFFSSKVTQTFLMLVLTAGVIHLMTQSYLSNYKYYSEPANPYVYAHTTNDIYSITKRVNDIANVHPNGKNMYINVICPENDYWPLPWYLRSFSNIGWWNKVDMDVEAAPLIIASPSMESDILKKIYELPPPGNRNLYVPLFDDYTELRPTIELRGYVMKDLWDKLQQ